MFHEIEVELGGIPTMRAADEVNSWLGSVVTIVVRLCQAADLNTDLEDPLRFSKIL